MSTECLTPPCVPDGNLKRAVLAYYGLRAAGLYTEADQYREQLARLGWTPRDIWVAHFDVEPPEEEWSNE